MLVEPLGASSQHRPHYKQEGKNPLSGKNQWRTSFLFVKHVRDSPRLMLSLICILIMCFIVSGPLLLSAGPLELAEGVPWACEALRCNPATCNPQSSVGRRLPASHKHSWKSRYEEPEPQQKLMENIIMRSQNPNKPMENVSLRSQNPKQLQ